MTLGEFEIEDKRVGKYRKLQTRKDNLDTDRYRISLGLIKIVAAYQNEVYFSSEEELKNKIIKAICRVYENEIALIEQEMKSI